MLKLWTLNRDFRFEILPIIRMLKFDIMSYVCNIVTSNCVQHVLHNYYKTIFTDNNIFSWTVSCMPITCYSKGITCTCYLPTVTRQNFKYYVWNRFLFVGHLVIQVDCFVWSKHSNTNSVLFTWNITYIIYHRNIIVGRKCLFLVSEQRADNWLRLLWSVEKGTLEMLPVAPT